MRELIPVPSLEEISIEYLKQLEPCHNKVHAHQPLDAAEVKKITEIRADLNRMYQPDIIQDSQIMRYIHHILGRNYTVSREVEEERLEAELRTLHVRLRDKGLAPDEREGIERERKSICQALYPEYHPPTS